MKNKIKTQIALLVISMMGSTSFAQTGLPSIAVASPQVTGLDTEQLTAEKILRIETAKLGKYNVYDQFDMSDAYAKDSNYHYNCQSKSCLLTLGNELDVDFIISGSYDKLGQKIVVNLKLINVNTGDVAKTGMIEFDDQLLELQRMTETVLKEMHGMEVPKAVTDRLNFQNEPITTNNVGKINNSGPRVGYAVLTGSVGEFATRSADRGGLDIFPGMSMIGYQFEAQYVGTEKFSALVEIFANVWGMEQGKFVPSLNLMNGLRFGDSGWEIAFGPGIGLSRTSHGFFDDKGLFGEKGQYFSDQDWNKYADATYLQDPAHTDGMGYYQRPSVVSIESSYNTEERHADTRGALGVSTHFVVGAGRTFRSGALSIPVNLFYSFKKKGGFAGASVGINIVKSKSKINSRKVI